LWVRRAPAAALAVLVLVAVALACVMLILFAQSRQARANAHQYAKRFVLQLRQAQEQGLTEGILTHIWLAEWLYGPTLLGEGPGLMELWELRKDVVRDYIARADARGADDDLQTLLWESALVFWLLKDGAFAEADALLVENRAAWEAKLSPTDEWLDHLRGLQACADVQRRLDGDTAPAGGRADIDLRAVADTLARIDDDLSGHAPGSPLHFLVLEHRRRLAGPKLLDNKALVKSIEERQKMLRE
jgi:hypothetical protein